MHQNPMKIEKTSVLSYYIVETDEYHVALQYQENLNIGYSEWQILSVQDKGGLEVELSRTEEAELRENIVKSILEKEKVD